MLHHSACCSAPQGRLLGTASHVAAWTCLPKSVTLLRLRCCSSLSAGLSNSAPCCKSLSSFSAVLPSVAEDCCTSVSAGSPATEVGTGQLPYLTEGICMAIVHHVEAAVHVDSHRRPLCRQGAAAPSDCTTAGCTRAGCVRLLLQECTSTGCTPGLCRGLLFGRCNVGLARQQSVQRQQQLTSPPL